MRILIVDDNKFDVRLAQRALKTAGMTPERLTTAEDGKAALNLLTGVEGTGQSIDLVLLDLNMPQMDGFEFLEAVRKDTSWASLPVVILTTSTRQEDVNRCYQLGCNAFHSKPSDMAVFEAMMTQLVQYWSRHVKLPQVRHLG